MSIPPSRMPRGTIIDHALVKLGNRKIKGKAREALNGILFDLYCNHEWPFLFTATTLSVSGYYFTLPTNFLKSQDDLALLIVNDGQQVVRYPVTEIDRQRFTGLGEPINSPGVPRFWTADRASSVGWVYPYADASMIATLRYKYLPEDEDVDDETTYDADLPEFPWYNYLIQAVYCWGLQHEEDSRYTAELAVLKTQLADIREAAMPLHAQIDQIPLDPIIFKTPFYED